MDTAGNREKIRRMLDTLLILTAVVWMIPVLGLLVASLRPASENAASGWWTALIHPGQLTFQAYVHLLRSAGVLGALASAILITVPSCLLLVAIAALAAYAFAWLRFPGREPVFLLVVGLLVVPIQVALIPVADLFGRLGLFGRLPGVVLFHVAFGMPFAVFLLRNFFLAIPQELLDAARMDGAGDGHIFLRVILPLGRPAVASLLIFQFLWVWNDLLVALVFAGPEAAPLTVFLRDQLRQFGANIDVIAPGAFLQVLVPLLVFFGFRRSFAEGILAGSLK